MEVLIITGLLLLLIRSVVRRCHSRPARAPRRTTPRTTAPAIPDPYQLARRAEIDRRRREKEHQQQARERERQLQREAVAKANESKAHQNMLLCEQYAEYIRSLREELDDSNISITRHNQVMKEILRVTDKVIKLTNDGDKAFYAAQAYYNA